MNLFQVTDGNYYLKAVTSENQDDMTDCRMFKSKTKAKTLMQSAEAFTQVIGKLPLRSFVMTLNLENQDDMTHCKNPKARSARLKLEAIYMYSKVRECELPW